MDFLSDFSLNFLLSNAPACFINLGKFTQRFNMKELNSTWDIHCRSHIMIMSDITNSASSDVLICIHTLKYLCMHNK